MKILASIIYKIYGWKIVGDKPKVKKAIIVSAPHTSNWDFFWGELAFLKIGLKASILMKKELFFFPLGPILRALHVIPVDRGNKKSGIVEQMVNAFNSRDEMYLCITPEGSRKKRKRWKKGFLIIAIKANLPIYLGGLDYKNKYCNVGPIYYPTGDIDKDMKFIMNHYKDANAKYPEKFSTGD